MKCPRCSKSTLFDVQVCAKCGYDFHPAGGAGSAGQQPQRQDAGDATQPPRHCSQCGSGLHDSARFCTQCGTAVLTAPAIATDAANPLHSDPAVDSGKAQLPASPQSSNILHARISGWFLLAMLLVAALAVYGYFSLEYSRSSRELLQRLLRRDTTASLTVRSVAFEDWYLVSEARHGTAIVDVANKGAFELKFSSISKSGESLEVQVRGIDMLTSGLRMALAEEAAPAALPSASADALPSASQPGFGITMRAYEKLTDGMSYSDVVTMIGIEGKEQSSSNLGGEQTRIMSWQSKSFSVITIVFINGKLASKSQFGLE